MEEAINGILGPSSNFVIEGLDKGRIETFSLTGGKLLKIMEKFSEVLVPIAYSNPKSDQSRKANWQAIGNLYMNGIQALHFKFEMNDSEILRTQEHLDNFGECWRQLQGNHSYTNYISDAVTGVFRFFLRRLHGSLYACANIGLEAVVGVLQSAYMRHTNKDCDDTIRQMASICFSKQALLWDKLQENSRSQLIQNGHTKELEKRKKTTALFQQNNIKGCMFDPKSNTWRRRKFKGVNTLTGKKEFILEVFQTVDDIDDNYNPRKKSKRDKTTLHHKLTCKDSALSKLLST